jgi:hypothetical protein
MLTDVFGKFCQLDFIELAAWIGFRFLNASERNVLFGEGIHPFALSGNLVEDGLRPSRGEWRKPFDFGFHRAWKAFRKEFHGNFVNAFLSVRTDSLKNGPRLRPGSE